MAGGTIPSSDSLFLGWLTNYSGLLSASPTSFGITGADASAMASITSQYITSYNLAVNPSTRNAGAVAAKDNYRANAEGRARQLANIIQSNPAITDQQKTDLGLLVRKTTKTPIAPPASSPLLAFIAATPGQHTLRFADQNTPAKRAKPLNVNALSLWYQIGGTTPPVDTSTMTFAGLQTKNPIGMDLPTAASGQTIYYIGKWITRTGLYGPASTVLSAKAI